MSKFGFDVSTLIWIGKPVVLSLSDSSVTVPTPGVTPKTDGTLKIWVEREASSDDPKEVHVSVRLYADDTRDTEVYEEKTLTCDVVRVLYIF